jgi:(1->4)-alpha-D-glucan 1-alpha-D-glucosylmutase
VDYEVRKRLLCELKKMTGADVASQVMMRADEGLPKMWTIHKALEVRRERPDCFDGDAEYTPIEVDGAKHDHVIAYLRGEDVVTVVPKLTLKLDNSWKDTIVVLPKGRWRNCLTGGVVGGGVIAMKLLLRDFPVALLVREGMGAGESDA